MDRWNNPQKSIGILHVAHGTQSQHWYLYALFFSSLKALSDGNKMMLMACSSGVILPLPFWLLSSPHNPECRGSRFLQTSEFSSDNTECWSHENTALLFILLCQLQMLSCIACMIMTLYWKSRWMSEEALVQRGTEENQKNLSCHVSCMLGVLISIFQCYDWGFRGSLQALHTNAWKFRQGYFLSHLSLYSGHVRIVHLAKMFCVDRAF